MEEENKRLETVKESFLQIIEAYNLNFGEMCGMFEDIKFEVWTELQEEDNELD